ncbi:hypothetical protein LMG10661_01686 [Ralstonia syzygii subsp. syzygii]|uniref:hypothetical protein n=1 Tax=Ralstonia pseudosolanacearum TaxID=1310165 RepID=UPI0008DAEE49|nr:hypothetical protein [Ralstonia pseudosolanacearum]MCL1618368.1 hypothetical protein [Ralstonia pseudosolanacearum CaRs-Mep]CAH0445468.1 hypothetical protein LMG10661_01686 [Ralstonia syzygii subsp. syzygii]
MNAGTVTLSTFENCHYRLGREDAPELKARGVIQVTAQPATDSAELRVELAGTRRHQRLTVVVPLKHADVDAIIRQMQAARDMLAHGGGHGA